MLPEDIYELVNAGDPRISADGLRVAFVVTAPHRGWVAVALLSAPLLLVGIDLIWSRLRPFAEDARENEALNEAVREKGGWPFDALLLVHAALHFALLAGYLRLAHREGMGAADFWVGAVLVGHNAGWSAIIVAHELIHRRHRGLQLLGRALLCTTFYEHFATEHVRGHHVRVGTGDDPATARFGESLSAFKRRTIPAQFRSAWRIECRRLGDEAMPFWDTRILRSRVVHGLVAEAGLVVAAFVCLGPAAVVALALQAWEAIGLLETVNYFEHWGLSRANRRVDVHDSWDTDSAFTRYALVGLARHADHHAHPARTYPTLRRVEESPKLPYGYPPMVLLATVWNARFRSVMTDALRRNALGPFARAD